MRRSNVVSAGRASFFVREMTASLSRLSTVVLVKRVTRTCMTRTRAAAANDLVLVDEFDRVLGYDNRKDVVRARARGRGVYAIITRRAKSSSGDGYDVEVLVTKRSEMKDAYPGRYCVCTSGACERAEGGAYDATIQREIIEELGEAFAASCAIAPMLFRFAYEDKVMRIFGAAYEVTCSGEATPAFADGEVTWAEFMPLRRAQEMLLEAENDSGGIQFTPIGRYVLGAYLAYKLRGATPDVDWNKRAFGGD